MGVKRKKYLFHTDRLGGRSKKGRRLCPEISNILERIVTRGLEIRREQKSLCWVDITKNVYLLYVCTNA